MSDSRVLVEFVAESHIAVVTLNRADKRNGMDLPMFEALVATGEALAARRDVRVIVLRGAGKAFCAGLDWASFLVAAPESQQAMLARTDKSPANLAQRACWIWQEAPQPVIAVLHGAVFGGGLQLALAADIRITAADAQLSVMESRYGLIPDMGATQTLLGVVREDIARELTYTARLVSGTEAVALGLATQLADDPFAAAMATATAIAQRSPDAIRAGKRLYQRSRGQSVATTFALETEAQLTLLGTPNQAEAVMAQMQKREPRFDDAS